MTDPAARSFAPIAAPETSLPRSLSALVDELWVRIAAGLDGRWPPVALPMLVTSSAEGPRARVLALRSIDPALRRFVFHTDSRSEKIVELRADPRVSLVFWDPALAIEARFAGVAEVHWEDEVARQAWNGVSPLRRIASGIVARPGSRLAAQERFDALRSTDDPVTARTHFAVVHLTATSLDWLWLGPHDMRRAMIRFTDAGMDAAWVVP